MTLTTDELAKWIRQYFAALMNCVYHKIVYTPFGVYNLLPATMFIRRNALFK